MKISIIIPTFNSEKTIGRTIQSIITQTFENWEILILDNLSTDATLEIIEAHGKDDPRVIVKSEPDNGIYDAMNKGIGNSSGDWLYFIGSDDFLYNELVFNSFFNDSHIDLSRAGIISGDIFFGDRLIGGPPQPANFFNGYPHQACFFHRLIFEKYLYEEAYKVKADQYLMMQVYSDQTFTFQHYPITVAQYNLGGFSGHVVDVRFANDAEKNISLHFPEIHGKQRYRLIKSQAFDTIRRGKWYLGIYWFVRGGVLFSNFRDILYCLKTRLMR